MLFIVLAALLEYIDELIFLSSIVAIFDLALYPLIPMNFESENTV